MADAGVRVTVASDLDVARRFIAGFHADQLPFAVAKALTGVAADCKRDQETRMRRTFTIRSRNFPRVALEVEQARKEDYPHAAAVVGVRDAFMALHVTGGIKRPRRARYLAIPTRLVQRTRSGRVQATHRPARLRQRGATFYGQSFPGPQRGSIVLGPKKKRGRGGRRLQRAGPAAAGQGRLRIYYLLRRRAGIDKRWRLVDECRRVVSARYDDRLRDSLDHAVRTARRRA